ncbi:hypothetical protein KP509_04G054100 [Ceratopteris richardii]|uniref:Uncharacterized protein n=1 Tax=Ceratopteris richardii TaxID=49495 RepID=A0A8T2V4V8_CERRI|nr:hypothetical protein KP509_04G054100 [Ceratopteris richardii]
MCFVYCCICNALPTFTTYTMQHRVAYAFATRRVAYAFATRRVAYAFTMLRRIAYAFATQRRVGYISKKFRPSSHRAENGLLGGPFFIPSQILESYTHSRGNWGGERERERLAS